LRETRTGFINKVDWNLIRYLEGLDACKVAPNLALHNRGMICINCQSNKVCKNGHRRGKQNYLCRDCGKQFLEFYSPKGYPDSIKEQCLTMYVNGLGFRAIERITGVNHNTVINWVKQVGFSLPDAPDYEEIPEVAELDELQTFVAQKKIRFG
jgi:transposase-like protein